MYDLKTINELNERMFSLAKKADASSAERKVDCPENETKETGPFGPIAYEKRDTNSDSKNLNNDASIEGQADPNKQCFASKIGNDNNSATKKKKNNNTG
jgi:hypothetical protein